MTKTPLAADVAIGHKIREVRIRRGLSQTELGQKAGRITFQQIQKYEKGSNRVGGSRLLQIAAVLGVEPAYLLTDAVEQATNPDKAEIYDSMASLHLTRLDVEIMHDVTKLKHPVKASLREVVHALAGNNPSA